MTQRWLYSEALLDASPSRRDGMTSGEEQRLRCEYCLFMEECSSNLRLTRLACSTGLVLFHRFFSLQSFMAHSGFEVAATCLFLASKVEESAKKLEVVITTCFGVWYETTLKTDSEDYAELRLQILKCERILLHTLSFDLCVEHPYKFLIETVKAVHHANMIQDSQKKDFAQRAVNFLNDR
jgi:hypothetical protein